MKKVVVTKEKRFTHVIGQEVQEEYIIKESSIREITSHVLDNLDAETRFEQTEDIDAIYNGVNGNYIFEEPDFIVNVSVSDADLGN